MNRPDLTGVTYEFHVIPVGGQAVGTLECRPGTRVHSVVPMPRGAVHGAPLQVLVVIEVSPSAKVSGAVN